jgi:hypothetical protein
MAPVNAYPAVFVRVFVSCLEQQGNPMFPDAKWHFSLRKADLEFGFNPPHPITVRDRLYNDETSRLSGVPEPSSHDGTKKWCAQFDRATAAFWAKRYGC